MWRPWRWRTWTRPWPGARAAGLEILYGPADEEWGVRRFFYRDHDGNVVNVLTHL
ncbi:VOC family protein [Streptomyces populi]